MTTHIAGTASMLVTGIPTQGTGVVDTQSFGASGDTSGLGDLSGPWFIETQTLHYDYLRVPIGSISSMDIGLSSVQLGGKIDKTILLVVANAEYHAVSSNVFYATSSFQQSQKFRVHSVSSGGNGEIFAGVTAGMFGPRGRVLTEKPFYSRKPYVEGRDIIKSEAGRGAMNFVAVSVSSNNGVSIPVILNEYQQIEDLMTSEHIFCWNTMMGAKGTLLGIEAQPQLNIKFGGYKPIQDKLEDVMITTNQLGTLFKQGYLTDGAGRPVDTWNHGTGMHNVIVSEYDITQHNWT